MKTTSGSYAFNESLPKKNADIIDRVSQAILHSILCPAGLCGYLAKWCILTQLLSICLGPGSWNDHHRKGTVISKQSLDYVVESCCSYCYRNWQASSM